jgi:hypothetical protein
MTSETVSFYIGTGSDAHHLGDTTTDKIRPPFPYRYSSDRMYNETSFIEDALKCGVRPDEDPETEPPVWIYTYVNGAIHVFHQNYLMAQVFPYGARNQTEFPTP